MHIRTQRLEQRRHGGLGKDDDEVHAAKRRDQLGAMLGGEDRPVLALERFHRRIVIDGDDEEVGLLRRRLEIPDVADVQDVEATVGERDGASRDTFSAHAIDERLARENFTHARGPCPWSGCRTRQSSWSG